MGRRWSFMLATFCGSALLLLMLDAFSSDSIPLHLLTREALVHYQGALAPGALLAVHISNRYLDLEPNRGGFTPLFSSHVHTTFLRSRTGCAKLRLLGKDCRWLKPMRFW